MNRRHCATAAIALVCALTVLASPGTAFAAPDAPHGPSAAGAPLAPRPPVPPGSASPTQDKSLEEVRIELEDLYHQAVSATDAYNLAEEEVERQSAEIGKLAREATKAQDRIDDLKDRAGASARAQYRGGGLPPEAQLMLTSDPQLFLDGTGRVQQGQKATRDLLRELRTAQAELKAYAEDAGVQWKKLEANRVKQAEARKKISAKIAAAKAIEDRLEKEERERLLLLEQQAASKAQTEWLKSGVMKAISGTSTEQGDKAVKFATAQVGKPYEWGAEGPGSYDCSGLTSQAWGAAGVSIPRTSQEQWRRLPRVEVKDMRPGDLIVYNADASHIGMYIGEGAIVHAPRPGRTVSLAGAGSMKILGVVRPGG